MNRIAAEISGKIGASRAEVGALSDLPLTAETPSRPYGNKKHKSFDLLGRVYEYFLG
jgi:type I restriction enzyme M protein